MRFPHSWNMFPIAILMVWKSKTFIPLPYQLRAVLVQHWVQSLDSINNGFIFIVGLKIDNHDDVIHSLVALQDDVPLCGAPLGAPHKGRSDAFGSVIRVSKGHLIIRKRAFYQLLCLVGGGPLDPRRCNHGDLAALHSMREEWRRTLLQSLPRQGNVLKRLNSIYKYWQEESWMECTNATKREEAVQCASLSWK